MQRETAEPLRDTDPRIGLHAWPWPVGTPSNGSEQAQLPFERQFRSQAHVSIDLSADRPERRSQIVGRNGQARAKEPATNAGVDLGIIVTPGQAGIVRIVRVKNADVSGETWAKLPCIAGIKHKPEGLRPVVLCGDEASRCTSVKTARGVVGQIEYRYGPAVTDRNSLEAIVRKDGGDDAHLGGGFTWPKEETEGQ